MRLLRQVELVGSEADRVLSLRRVLEANQHFTHADERLLPIGRPLDLDARPVEQVALGRTEALLETIGEVGGIQPGGQRDDVHLEALRRRELHPAKGRRLARCVTVEAQPESRRQAAELLQLTLGERGAHRGDDGLDAGLPQREHVGVSFHDDRALLLRDRRARVVEPVEQVALAKELAFGRVHVLRPQRIVLAQLPRLEPEHSAARIGEREQQAAGEVVVAAAVDEAGGCELLACEASFDRLTYERRAAERETEAVLAAHLFVQPPSGKVVARERAGLRVPQVPLVERCSRVEQLVQSLPTAAARILLRRRLLVLDLDVEPVREPLDRAREVQLLGLAHERDHVAFRAAAEAVVELLHRIHGEARSALLVEGAARDVARPGLA